MNRDTMNAIADTFKKAEEVQVERADELAKEPENNQAGNQAGSQADILIDLATDAKLFHTPDKIAYATLEISEHRENWPINGKIFKQWLQKRYYETVGGAPSSEALKTALSTIEAEARFAGCELEVHMRVAGYGGKLYLDLSDDQWRVVEIDNAGWRVVTNPPVRFRRSAGMRAIPIPESGGSIETLRKFLNVRNENDFVLAVTWLLAAFCNTGPYPLLVLSGEQGSAKSTFSAILRTMLDPNKALLRALPRSEQDFFIAATKGHVLVFDNLSYLKPELSDTLCRLATGGGFAVRQLYTDQDEVIFEASKPMILNGIEDVATRSDLADRAIMLTLEPIADDQRKLEKELWAEFDAYLPSILGVLLDAVAHGLKRLPDTKLDLLPRMADFARWGVACETAFWPQGTFMKAYCDNRDEAVENVIEADTVASAVRIIMQKNIEWDGTSTELLDVLEKEVSEHISKSSNWPKNARALSGRLKRAAPNLRKIGIIFKHDRQGRMGKRIINITVSARSATSVDKVCKFASVASVPSAIVPDDSETPRILNVLADFSADTNADANYASADTNYAHADTNITAKPWKYTNADGADATDANLQPLSTASTQAGHESGKNADEKDKNDEGEQALSDGWNLRA